MAQKKEKTGIDVTVKVTKQNVAPSLKAQIKKRQEAINASPYACDDIADKVARETSKKQIEDFATQLRARRKAYVFSEMTAEDEQKMRLTA